MDTKSKKIKLQNIVEKYYKYILIGIAVCLALSVWSCINVYKYKDPKYGHSSKYLHRKGELDIWHQWSLIRVDDKIYKKTNYYSIFKEDQNTINTYSEQIDLEFGEYLIYNKKTNKYLTNSEDVKGYIDRYKKDIVTIIENIADKLAYKEITEGTPLTMPAYEVTNSKGKTVYPSDIIENPKDYLMCFWIPKKAMETNGYFGVVSDEDYSIRIQKSKYTCIFIVSLVSLIALYISTRTLEKKRRIEAINKILVKRAINELKRYIVDSRSIPFKSILVGVLMLLLGLGLWCLYYLVFIWKIEEDWVFYTAIGVYIAIIIIIFIVWVRFTIKLQRIIDSSESFSSNLFENKYKEKNLKKLSEGMEKMREGFKEAMDDQMKSERLKAELVTNISHDLKTPLTSIINYTDILLNKDITEEEKIDYLKVLNNKGLKLKLLIEDLFEISKISTGKEKINKESVNLIELINQSLGELSSNIQESNIKFYVNSSNRDIMLELDGKRMSRVFENLISNITKYSLTGTRAYIDVSENDNTVNIVFKNMSRDEINIDPDEIFNRFTRGDNSRNSKVEGSGLGLAIAKSIVDLHIGKMKVNIDGDLFKVEIELPK